jgi:hypothetical protein
MIRPVALISADALAGYLLEEAIAFLLSSNGYRLLQDSDADEQALRQAGHGLLVRAGALITRQTCWVIC